MAVYRNYETEGSVFEGDREYPVIIYHREWWNWEIEVFRNPLTGEWEGDAIAYGEFFDIDEDTPIMYYGQLMSIPEVLKKLDEESE